MPNFTPATAILAKTDYPNSHILAQRGTDPNDIRRIPVSKMPLTDSDLFARAVPFFFTTPPNSLEKLGIYAAMEQMQLADDFLGLEYIPGVNPAATYTITVQKWTKLTTSWSVVGTISITTGGVVTPLTSGGVVDLLKGDGLRWLGQATYDAAIRDWAFTHKAFITG
jgi:hypothetical protein